MTSEPNLTPPIVDPVKEPPKPENDAAPVAPIISDEAAAVAGLSPTEVEKGLRATLTKQNSDLEHALSEKKRWSTKVTELRAAVKETERWLRAATPRTRKPK